MSGLHVIALSSLLTAAYCVGLTTNVVAVFAVLAGAQLCYSMYHNVKSNARKVQLKETAKKARELRDKEREKRTKDKNWLKTNLSDKESFSIVHLSAVDLLKAIHGKQFSCEDVMKTFIFRAIKSAALCNSAAQEPFEEALEAARVVDRKIAKGEKLRPLEGLPIVWNKKAVMPLVDWLPKRFNRMPKMVCWSSLCAMLAPFLLFAALMLPESHNWVWGRTDNPYNAQRGPGGSSGGEGALLACRATPLAVGTDIGGSLRIPAHFCGVVCLKPTPLRVTRLGSHMPRHQPYGSQPHIMAVAGPMANRVDDLSLLLKHAWWTDDTFASDTKCVPMKYNDELVNSKRKLTIGWYDFDGYFDAAPACRRAVSEAVAALETAGHRVVAFAPPRVEEAVTLFYGLLAADGNFEGFMNALDGEELLPAYKSLALLASLPLALRPLLAKVLSLLGEQRSAGLVQCAGAKSASELWKVCTQQNALVRRWLDEWRAAEIDVLLCPALALPAFTHGASKDLTPAYNLLHFPAGVLPVTHVRKEEATKEAYLSSIRGQTDRFSRLAAAQCEGSQGLPVGVQVVAPPFRDELVLRVMKELEVALDKARGGPFKGIEL